MKKRNLILKISLITLFWAFIWFWYNNVNAQEAWRFDTAMDKSTQSIKNNIDAASVTKGTEWVKEFVFDKVTKVLLPLIVVLGILIAILGFYKILFSDDEKAKSDWIKYIWYWALWIILIISAKYFGTTIYESIFHGGDNTKITDIVWW